ncbi:putative holin-like toxin [Limosilactobacillus fermentum]
MHVFQALTLMLMFGTFVITFWITSRSITNRKSRPTK